MSGVQTATPPVAGPHSYAEVVAAPPPSSSSNRRCASSRIGSLMSGSPSPLHVLNVDALWHPAEEETQVVKDSRATNPMVPSWAS